jgi:delta11-fatty-acid desaturase
MRGHDVSFMFHSYHFRFLPEISKYKVTGVAPTVTPFSCDMKKDDPFFQEVRATVRKEFQGKSTKPSLYRITWICAMILTTMILFLEMLKGHYIGLFSVFLYWTSMGCIFHDCEHFAFTRNELVKWLVRIYSAYFIDAPTWRAAHNYTHHVYSNILDYDSDLAHNHHSHRSIPNARYKPQFAYQMYYYVFLLMILVFPVRLLHSLIYIATKKLARKLPRHFPVPWGEMILLTVIKLTIFYFMSVRPFYIFGFWKALFFALWFPIIFSLQFMVFSQINHLTETSTRGLSTKAWSADTWSKHQIMTSTNWSIYKDSYTNSLEDWIHYLVASFWFVYSCGLNYQIEHHLFPSVNHEYLPQISIIVRQLCAKHNVRYNNIGGFVDAVRAHLVHLNDLSKPAVEVMSKVN